MADIHAGQILAGKYKVERILGAGGMGYVVAARHLHLDQTVALKFIRPGALETEEAKKRFLREAKAAVRLRSEHVARVLDVGTMEGGEPYMVMEYLEGCDLQQLSKERGSVPVAEAADYMIQACEALGDAHGQDIVHRDIKLANLFVTRGPAGMPLVKVLDFGISKHNPFADTSMDMTGTSEMLGSPRFMSPEQMQDARTVDARSDIWSMGVVLYKLVTGKTPFEAENLGRLFSMVMHQPIAPPTSIVPTLPTAFSDLIMRCLERDRDRRFASVAELALALAPFCSQPARAHAMAEQVLLTLQASGTQQPILSSRSLGIPPSSPDSHPSHVSHASVTGGERMASGVILAPAPGPDASSSAWGGTRAGKFEEAPKSSRGPLYAFMGFVVVSVLSMGFFLRTRQVRDEVGVPEAQATAQLPAATALPPAVVDPRTQPLGTFVQPGALPPGYVVQPGVAQPVAQPGVMQPGVMQPGVMQPGVMQPAPTAVDHKPAGTAKRPPAAPPPAAPPRLLPRVAPRPGGMPDTRD
jgi:eukaryotic-like serine/threonine-protein kinase